MNPNHNNWYQSQCSSATAENPWIYPDGYYPCDYMPPTPYHSYLTDPPLTPPYQPATTVEVPWYYSSYYMVESEIPSNVHPYDSHVYSTPIQHEVVFSSADSLFSTSHMYEESEYMFPDEHVVSTAQVFDGSPERENQTKQPTEEISTSQSGIEMQYSSVDVNLLKIMKSHEEMMKMFDEMKELMKGSAEPGSTNDETYNPQRHIPMETNSTNEVAKNDNAPNEYSTVQLELPLGISDELMMSISTLVASNLTDHPVKSSITSDSSFETENNKAIIETVEHTDVIFPVELEFDRRLQERVGKALEPHQVGPPNSVSSFAQNSHNSKAAGNLFDKITVIENPKEALLLYKKLLRNSKLRPDDHTYLLLPKSCDRLNVWMTDNIMGQTCRLIFVHDINVRNALVHVLVCGTKLGVEFYSFIRVSLGDMYVKEELSDILQLFVEVTERTEIENVLCHDCRINGFLFNGEVNTAKRLMDSSCEHLGRLLGIQKADQHQLQTVAQKFVRPYNVSSSFPQDAFSPKGSPTRKGGFTYRNYTNAGLQYSMTQTYAIQDPSLVSHSPVFFQAQTERGMKVCTIDSLISGFSSTVSKTAAPVELVKLLIRNQDEMLKTGSPSEPYGGIRKFFSRTMQNERNFTNGESKAYEIVSLVNDAPSEHLDPILSTPDGLLLEEKFDSLEKMCSNVEPIIPSRGAITMTFILFYAFTMCISGYVSGDNCLVEGTVGSSIVPLLLPLFEVKILNNVIFQVSTQNTMIFSMSIGWRSSTVHDEAILAIGTLVYTIGLELMKCVSELYKYLGMGQNLEEYYNYFISDVGVGDTYRALEDKPLPYCVRIMIFLLKDLSSTELHRSAKPLVFLCFGDIALVCPILEDNDVFKREGIVMIEAEIGNQQVGEEIT